MKRILALVLCFVMLFSLVAVADEATTSTSTTEFSDVPATSPYREAISTLAGLGIILGDGGANTFRPEAGITRAEFCVIVARLKNMGALNVPAETSFKDVTTAVCDEWKVKAIRIASDLKVVAGMGDGTFQPDSPVTYEQAVKMLVCLLKYEPMAKGLGGWPAGYIAAGSQIGLTAKAVATATEPAPRQIIAQLVYNALDIPEMNTTTDGVPGGGSSIIDSTLKYKEYTGIVTATYDMSLTEDNAAIKQGQIQLDNDKIFNVGSSGAEKYFGKEINFYYSEDDNILTIQSCKLTKSNKEYTFTPDEIKHLAQDEVQYYIDEDYDKYDSYPLENNVKLVYNGYPAPYVETSAGYLDSAYKPYSGSLKLIDNDANNTIDVIIINDAKPFVVSAIDISKNLLYNVYDSSDVLDLTESSSKKITIKKGSATVNFSAIAKNNVLLVSKSLNTIGTKYINIEIVSNTKTGVIKAMSTEDRTITIGSESYEISDICWNKYSSKFQMDSSVTIYLDNMKKIVYIVENAAAASTYTYGYLVSAGYEGQGLSAEKVSAVIFSQDGMLKTYPLAEKVKINNEQKSSEDTLALLDSTARTDINKDLHKVEGSQNKLPAITNSCSQLIKYSLNAKSEINAIYTSVPSAADLAISNNLILGVGTQQDKTYKSGTKMLGTSAVNTSTKFFFIPRDRTQTDDYSVGKNTALADNRTYTYETYDVDGGIAKVVVVFGDISLPVYDISSPIAIVSKIQEINTEDGAAYKFFVNDSTTSYTTEDLNVLNDVEVGDVIKIKRDTKGIVTEVMKLYSPSTGFLYTYANGAKRLAATNSIDIRNAKETGPLDGDFCIMQGTVGQLFYKEESTDLSMMYVYLEDVQGEGADATLGDSESTPYPISLTSSSTAFYTYSISKGTLEKTQTLVSFEDAKSGASKVYISSVDGTPRVILTVID